MEKNEKIIQDEIIRIAKLSMERFMDDFKSVACEHEWRHEGFSYGCKKCGFYVGANLKLSKAIYKLIYKK